MEIIINPESLASKLAHIALRDYAESLLIESAEVASISNINNLVYEEDGEVKSDFFDFYTGKYDYYFEIITNEMDIKEIK